MPLRLCRLRSVATANVVGILWSAAMFARARSSRARRSSTATGPRSSSARCSRSPRGPLPPSSCAGARRGPRPPAPPWSWSPCWARRPR